ncbi:MAG: class I SAM-dependent methyltransferase [Chloroflexia bacterium]
MEAHGKSKDKWASGDLYEPYVGRWSKRIAEKFVAWLGVLEGKEWLDVGCGTGALTSTIMEIGSPLSVIGIDPSEGFLQYARNRVQDERARFDVGDARAIPYGDGRFDAVVSGLVLNFVPDTGQAIREMARVARPGGMVAAYVWDYAEKMELMRYFWDTAIELDPNVASLDESPRFPIARPEALEKAWRDNGMVEVEARGIDVPTPFRDFDDYWAPFLGGQGPAPGYAMSLSEEKRGELREVLRGRLPTEGDGSIRLIARAWGVRGMKRG